MIDWETLRTAVTKEKEWLVGDEKGIEPAPCYPERVI